MNGICHVDIPSTDFARSAKFYGPVFSWQFQEIKELNYMLFTAPEGISGGFTPEFLSGQKPGVIFFIEVEDVERALQKVEAHGGKTIVGKKMISPEFGYLGIFADPSGNQIELWSKK